MTNQTNDRYVALPMAGKGPGVLVLHPWWGLNDDIRDFCDRLAKEGFIALAPDLYHGKLAKTVEEAEQLSGSLNMAQAGAEVLAADEALRGLAPVQGLVGFSLGASFALWLVQQRPKDFKAVTLFYGTRPGDYSAAQAAFLGHFAEHDPYEAAEDVQALETGLRAADRPMTFYTYPGTGHWFFEKGRKDAYNKEAANLAWDRTLAFLSEQLKG